MTEMSARYELTNQQSYRVKLNHQHEPRRYAIYVVYEFHAKGAGAESSESDVRAPAYSSAGANLDRR